MTEHTGVCPGGLDAGGRGELAQAAGGGVPVHPVPRSAGRDRPACAGSGCPVNGPADGGRQRDQDHLGALAAGPQDPVAVLFAGIGDVRSGGLADPRAGQAGHGRRREVARVR
jgi:hypothetical protein